MIRSGLRPSKAALSPAVSDSPITRSAGTSTSSKKSVHCLSEAFTATGMNWASNPGESTSTSISSGSPSVPSSSRLRAITSIVSASSIPEMKVFVPRSL